MHWLDAASIWRSNLSLDLRRPLRYAKRNHSTFGCCETKRIRFRQSYRLRELVRRPETAVQQRAWIGRSNAVLAPWPGSSPCAPEPDPSTTADILSQTVADLCGEPYRALDPELLDWVSATAVYGFLTAYDRFVAPVSPADRRRYFAESGPIARLYGVQTVLSCEADFSRR